MIPNSSADTRAVISNEQKIYSIQKFIEENPFYEVQDLYRWLYNGEFGDINENNVVMKKGNHPELISILDDINQEKEIEEPFDRTWEPMGLSFRFIAVYLSPYHLRQCPLNRVVNLIERSPAFRGNRVHFKLDWVFLKDYIIKKSNKFTKFDFYGFEDRYNFHQIPNIPFTESYIKNKPRKYRIVPRKLFFDFFPEFDSRDDIIFSRPKDSLID